MARSLVEYLCQFQIFLFEVLFLFFDYALRVGSTSSPVAGPGWAQVLGLKAQRVKIPPGGLLGQARRLAFLGWMGGRPKADWQSSLESYPVGFPPVCPGWFLYSSLEGSRGWSLGWLLAVTSFRLCSTHFCTSGSVWSFL